MTPPDLVSALRALLDRWRIVADECHVDNPYGVQEVTYRSLINDLAGVLARIATPAQEPTQPEIPSGWAHVPKNDGGMQYEYHALGYDIEVECDSDGRLEAIDFEVVPVAPVTYATDEQVREAADRVMEKHRSSLEKLAGGSPVPPHPKKEQ